MDADNLIFSSKIDPQVEDVCFDILLNHFSDEEFDKVVKKYIEENVEHYKAIVITL